MGNTTDPYCQNCVYCAGIYGGLSYCNYLFRTNQRRPCPPGEGCTVKVPMKIYRKKKKKGESK